MAATQRTLDGGTPPLAQLPLDIAAALADPLTDLSREDALAAADPDDRRELCERCRSEAVYPRRFADHLTECDAVDRDPFPDADSQEVAAR